MAIAFDAVGGGNTANGQANAANMTWSHTSTGSDRCVIVGIAVYPTSGVHFSSIARSVTYGGVSMTSLGALHTNNTANASNVFMELFYLQGQSTGSQTVSVTTVRSGDTFYLLGNSASYTGVGSVPAAQTTFGTGATPSQVVASTSGDYVAQAFVAMGTTVSSYNQTARFSANNPSVADVMQFGDAPGAAPNVSFSASISSANWAAMGVSLASVGGGVNTGAFFDFF